MKPTVYLDTSLIGYLTSRLSKGELVRSRQLLTRRWWRDERAGFGLRVSRHVLQELDGGDPAAAQERREAVKDVAVLGEDSRVAGLADVIRRAVHLPPRAAEDASHLASATLAGMDYLLTWNFRHLANEHNIRKLRPLLADMGHRMTTITDPQRLMTGGHHDDANPGV